jgi:ribonuclease R
MKFTVADLLDQLSTEESLPLAKLERSLGISESDDSEQLQIGLDGLARLGLLASDEEGVRRIEQPELIAARLRCSSKGFCFALRDDGGDDIYIRDHQLNHAWNGDRVLVQVQREGGRRRSPEGAVCCILARQTSSLLAQVEQRDGELVAVPLDDRLLSAIALPPADADHLERSAEAVVEVAVDRFPVAQFPAAGHVARSLPVQGGADSDIDLLLTKHHLHQRPAAPRTSLKTPSEAGREDLSAMPTLLLEVWNGGEAPPLAALSLETLENGGLQLWVHAPTIAERVTIGGSLDLWMRDCGDALCLGSRWLPLLPPALARAARFSVGSEQDALSVALEIGPDGELLHHRFRRSRIRPDALVNAAALAALADRKPKARTLPAALKPLKDHLLLLEGLVELTTRLHDHRQRAGALELALAMPEIPGLADLACPRPDAGPEGWLVTLPVAHPSALLREALLLADRALGRHFAALDLPGLYASNPEPEQADLNELARTATALEIPLELSEEGNASAPEMVAAFAGTDRCRALHQQVRDVLPAIQLGASPAAHRLAGEEEALAPWTSPAIHYASIWNQHLLVSLLCDGKDRPSVRHKVSIDLTSDACHGAVDWALLTPGQLAPYQEGLDRGMHQRLNDRWRFSRDLAQDALAMAQARQGQALVGQVLPGVISGVQSYGFFVEVPPSQLEGLVHVSSLKDDWYEYRSRQNRLVGRKNRRSYRLGDPVEVEILKVDALRHQIDLAVIAPEIDGDPEDPESGEHPADDQPEDQESDDQDDSD